MAQNPNDRYSADQALQHPWVTRDFDRGVPLTFWEKNIAFNQQHCLQNIFKAVLAIKYIYRGKDNAQYVNMLKTQEFSIKSIRTESSNDESISSDNTDDL